MLRATTSMLVGLFLLLAWRLKAVSGACTKTDDTPTSGTIFTDGYPHRNYDSHSNCEYVISFTQGYTIRLQFMSPFALEGDCDYDSVKLYEEEPPGSNSFNFKKRYCGTTVPEAYMSTSSKVKVTFTSDGSQEYKGFKLTWERVGGLCTHELSDPAGGVLSASRGMFHTGDLCVWLIKGSPLVRFQLRNLYDRLILNKGDTLQVSDVLVNSSEVSRGRWGVEDTPPPEVITSFTPVMKVTVRLADVGTQTAWRAVENCGEQFTALEGHIISPDYFYPEPTHDRQLFGMDCTWDIMIPSGFRTLLSFDKSMDRSVCLSNLQIWETGDRKDTAYYNYPHNNFGNFRPLETCVANGNVTSLNDVATSTSMSTLRIALKPGDVFHRGLFVHWKTVCGHTSNSKTGYFESPGFGSEGYSSNLDCEWVLQRQRDYNALRFSFRYLMDIEMSNNNTCVDYVELLELSDEGELTSLGRFCGSQMPPVLTSSSEKVVVRFHSDESKQGQGFRLWWDTVCYRKLRALQGNFTSPLHPSEYPDNTECRWDIEVPEGFGITLSFPHFELESSTDCGADYVEIWDYTPEGTRETRGRWCGNDAPPPQTSLTSRLMVGFLSDYAKEHSGFHAQWTTSDIASTACGEEFRDPQGNVTSPGYPDNYPDNLRCRWEIQAVPGQRVKLQFGSTFDLEVDRNGCRYDGVEVLDTLPNGKLLSYGTWCDSNRIPVFFSWSRLVVRFYSDTEKSGQGFSATWNNEPECGAMITGRAGHLLSPNYPADYPADLECTWEITPNVAAGGADSNVTLHFDPRFDLEGQGDGCQYDFVMILRGIDAVGLWCGSEAPPDVTSYGETLTVVFKSDKSVTGKGFLATLI